MCQLRHMKFGCGHKTDLEGFCKNAGTKGWIFKKKVFCKRVEEITDTTGNMCSKCAAKALKEQRIKAKEKALPRSNTGHRGAPGHRRTIVELPDLPSPPPRTHRHDRDRETQRPRRRADVNHAALTARVEAAKKDEETARRRRLGFEDLEDRTPCENFEPGKRLSSSRFRTRATPFPTVATAGESSKSASRSRAHARDNPLPSVETVDEFSNSASRSRPRATRPLTVDKARESRTSGSRPRPHAPRIQTYATIDLREDLDATSKLPVRQPVRRPEQRTGRFAEHFAEENDIPAASTPNVPANFYTMGRGTQAAGNQQEAVSEDEFKRRRLQMMRSLGRKSSYETDLTGFTTAPTPPGPNKLRRRRQ